MRPSRVNITSERVLQAEKFFRLTEVEFSNEEFNGGMSPQKSHILFDRGDSVAVLMHDQTTDEVILVEQFRVATLSNGPGWILEVPAGKLEPGESPEAAALREIEEETGAKPESISHITTFYVSPGACTERIHLFYAGFPGGASTTRQAGVAVENEDILVHRVALSGALEMISRGEIVDAKTLVALLWLTI